MWVTKIKAASILNRSLRQEEFYVPTNSCVIKDVPTNTSYDEFYDVEVEMNSPKFVSAQEEGHSQITEVANAQQGVSSFIIYLEYLLTDY